MICYTNLKFYYIKSSTRNIQFNVITLINVYALTFIKSWCSRLVVPECSDFTTKNSLNLYQPPEKWTKDVTYHQLWFAFWLWTVKDIAVLLKLYKTISSWEDFQTHVLFQFYFNVIKKSNISYLNVIDHVLFTCNFILYKIKVLRNIWWA